MATFKLSSHATNQYCPASDGDDLDSDHGEIGVDEDEDILAAVRQSKVKQASAEVSKYHKHGTKSMGIKLKTAEISACDAVLPAIIDWAGTLEKPFTVNSHPNLQDIVEDNWKEEFPEIPADDAVQAVASSAIRNWRSAIGKHALLRLMKIFATEPFKNSKNQHKEYVEKELKGLSYIYRDPVTKSGAYRSATLMEVYAAHQQVIMKTDNFYGYGAGALSLCAAAHERALKLWQTGNAPTKDIKKSFVCKPWAIWTAAHYKVVSTLSKRVWGEIHEASLSVINPSSSLTTYDPALVCRTTKGPRYRGFVFLFSSFSTRELRTRTKSPG
ncbi:hypothetical protein BYT27DRAFT_7343021 [Phlegmacium glaucopus]|nr:hypothetical protein BYT27DRAFT_7343021 [Phlegmacium glaucopus]